MADEPDVPTGADEPEKVANAETRLGAMDASIRRAMAAREVSAAQRVRDELSRARTTTAQLQEQMEAMLRPARELENVHAHLEALEGKFSLTQAQLAQLSGVTGAKEMREQLDKRVGVAEYSELRRLIAEATALTAHEQMHAELKRFVMPEGDVGWLTKAANLDTTSSVAKQAAEHAAMQALHPFWLHLRDDYASLVPRVGSVAQQMRKEHEAVVDSAVGRTAKEAHAALHALAGLDVFATAKPIAAERETVFNAKMIAAFGSIGASSAALLEQVVGRIDPVAYTTAHDDILRALVTPPQELREKVQVTGQQIASQALVEATPQDALNRLVKLLGKV